MPGKRSKGRLKKPKSSEDTCIIHDAKVKDSNLITLTEASFEKIKSVSKIRQTHPSGSCVRQNEICMQIPQEFNKKDGYHRKCYQRFTNNKSFLKPKEDLQLQKERPKRNVKEGATFKPNCIF